MERGDPTRLPEDRNTRQAKTFPAAPPIRPAEDDKVVMQMNGSH
jgi:hypothetical protein